MNNLNEQQVKLKAFLDGLYYAYSRRELIHPDPLYFLYCYDRENLEAVGIACLRQGGADIKER